MNDNKIREIRLIRENPRFRRYPEYKESGVEWIGKIPGDWKVNRLKYIADLNMGQSPLSEEYNSDQIGTPFLQGNAEFGSHHPTPKIYCPTAKKYADPGDILLSVRAPVGAINIANQEYGIGRGLCAIRPRTNQLEHRYAKYLLEVVRTELHSVATGSTYDAVTVDEVSNTICVVPPLSEQTQIANFLDRKTEQIDELIRIKERRIELLQEQRTALINQAVTKGLDPNVEMKPSGVEWIAEIPRHWNLSMLKYTARLVYGDTLISENREEGVVPVYGSNGIIDTHSSANTLSPAIVVGRKGSLGKIQYSDVPCFVIDTAYYIDRRTSHVTLRWLYYVLQALKLERFRNSVLPGLNRESAEGQYVPLITAEEQVQTANFLDRKTEQIDELVNAEQRKIELLKEYRQSLISEAVTGKIDVRNEV